MIPVTQKEGKNFATASQLTNWERNPRGIKAKDFERLKAQISKLGQYKPLLITPEGVVLGGNMRLKAYAELGITDIWVSVVEPKTEAEKVEYALSDNDRAGYYEDQQLAELVEEFKSQIPLDLYKVDLSYSLDLQRVLDTFAPVPGERGEGDNGNELGERLDTYLNGTIRQIVLFFTIKEYEIVLERIKKVMEKEKLTDNTAVVLALLNFYEQHISD